MAREAKRRHTSAWEWAIAAVGALLVLGTIAVLAIEGATQTPVPPDVVLGVDSIVPLRNGYVVEFSADNRGTRTAAGLVVEATLQRGATMIERSQVTLDYVPAGAKRNAGLYFTRDPRTLSLELRASGYQAP